MSDIDIDYETHVLGNGLRLIAHRDGKLPIVTCSLWYHVGSKNESPGRTGYAHLFEHLMFEGSEHHDGEYFRPLELAGASTINGTTSRDRTNYYQTVPIDAFDLALWLESDRMGHFLGVLTEEKLDEQREVVRNEKRQSENQPYGRVSALLSKSLYPIGHPYSWPIIGSMEDLDAANLEDMRTWFETYYRPNNAVLVLSGDVDPEEAFERAGKHFGAISSGPPLERPGEWIARLPTSRRVTLEDRVPQARIYRAWNVPPTRHPDCRSLSLLTGVLSHGKSSRLHRRLVLDEQIATAVSAYVWAGEIGSSFIIEVSCAPGESSEKVEQVLDEELSTLLADGVAQEELERARSRSLSGFLRQLQRTGGPGGKSEVLAHGEIFHGDAGSFRRTLAEIERATVADLEGRGDEWLSGGHLTVVVEPVADWASTTVDVDRTALPKLGEVPRPRLPDSETLSLSNGLEVIFAPWGTLPLVHLSLLADAGFAAELDLPRGTASLTMSAIDEGTESRSALEISDRLALLGARIFASAELDNCRIALSSLAGRLRDSLELFAEVIRRPTFPEEEVERLKKQRLARIARERAAPMQLALRVLPRLLYGSGHPYALPFTGSGSESDVEAIERAHLQDFHATRLGPQNATLLCVGNPDRREVLDHLEGLLGDWRPQTVERNDLPEAAPQAGARILLLDRPGSIQSIVFGAQVVPPRNHRSELELELFNFTLGGAFTSRLNLNLREDKGWTYGAHSLLWSARGQRPFLLYASVQADRTGAALEEMHRELEDMLGERPVSTAELDLAKSNLVRSLPASWETLGGLSAALEEIIAFELPADYYDRYVDGILALSPDDVTSAARRWIHPERFLWVVVGDLAQIRAQIDDLALGPVEEIVDD